MAEEGKKPEDRPIEDVIADIVADVPASEWEKVPTDLSANLDHYLYGAPKRGSGAGGNGDKGGS